jgi:hypothetical protein
VLVGCNQRPWPCPRVLCTERVQKKPSLQRALPMPCRSNYLLISSNNKILDTFDTVFARVDSRVT